MSTYLQNLLSVDRALTAQMEHLQRQRESIRADIAKECPAKPGQAFESCYGPMWVTSVTVRPGLNERGSYEWTISGRKLRKDGTPHATAWAGAWLAIPGSEGGAS